MAAGAPSDGVIIFDTDQDWVRETISPALMENILVCLLAPRVPTVVTSASWGGIKAMFR